MSAEPTVGYYVHHHGQGHRRRFEALHSVIGHRLVAVSQLDLTDSSPESTRLPDDATDACPVDPSAGGVLHWAPITPAATRRLVHFVGFLDHLRPVGVVIDVSVEAAMTCRLAGVPVVYVRQHGDRTDTAHTSAYRSARRLLAPWPEELEDPSTPAWVVAKTDYSGYIASASPRCEAPVFTDATDIGSDDIVMMSGTGGGVLDDAIAARVAQSTDRRVFVAGPGTARPSRRVGDGAVVHLGWVEPSSVLLIDQPLVIATAGNNAVAEAATNGCALVTVPMPRPFGEQLAHARRLAAIGAAVCVEQPDIVDDWVSIIDLADQRRHALGAIASTGGAARAARAVLDAFAT